MSRKDLEPQPVGVILRKNGLNWAWKPHDKKDVHIPRRMDLSVGFHMDRVYWLFAKTRALWLFWASITVIVNRITILRFSADLWRLSIGYNPWHFVLDNNHHSNFCCEEEIGMIETVPQDSAKTNELNDNTNQDRQVEMIFSVDSPYQIQYTPQTWYQKNLDVLFPLFIIGIGLFQGQSGSRKEI